MEGKKGFYWECFPGVESFFLAALDDFRTKNPVLAQFESLLLEQTSTGLLDWADHLVVPEAPGTRKRLEDLGFVGEPLDGVEAFRHPGVMLPTVVPAGDSSGGKQGIAIAVESIADFLRTNGFQAGIEGPPFGRFRRATVSDEGRTALWAVERRGGREMTPRSIGSGNLKDYFEAVEAWKGLPRRGVDESHAFSVMLKTSKELASRLGAALAAHVVCRCERTYWLSRNLAGCVQGRRQESLGLGWANHDHHTFRSSRRHFSRLIKVFLQLGFQKRERFYAGREAGWGAQVMENPEAGLVLFLDVDLSPEEVSVDFTAGDLEEKETLGTVGLWCALHGDSIMKAGMHHLAARYDFDRLIGDVSAYGIGYMAPFSDFPYLRQAFSIAEKWETDPARVAELQAAGAISKEQAGQFLSRGAVGSHLENIQRREGYKGFNRKNVSAIIRETDPRRG